MSTNYYLNMPACDNACPHCAREQEIHLGQSAAGWRFLHRAYREYQPLGVLFPVVDRASWLKLLGLGVIYDEYGHQVERDELLSRIEQMQDRRPRWGADGPSRRPADFTDGEYYFADAEFS